MQGKIFEYIEEKFDKPLTLVFGYMLIIFSIVPLDSLFENVCSVAWIRYLIYLPIFITWTIYWVVKRKWIPRNVKNMVGLVLCIQTENDKQKKRLKNDLVQRINELIGKQNLTKIINIIFLNEKQSEIVNSAIQEPNNIRGKIFNSSGKLTKFGKVQKRINGNFYVLGSIKERKDVENKYFLNLDGLVVHDRLEVNSQTSLKNEFQNIWARSIEFQEKVEFKGFLLSADLIFIAVQYIVGLAALYSGKAFIAVNLHKKVEQTLSRIKNPPPNLTNVLRKLQELIPQEYFVIAYAYNQLSKIEDAEKYLKLLFKREPNNYNGLLLKSIIEFSHYNQPEKSLETNNHAKKYSNNDGTWMYNQGFLLLFLTKFEEALKKYKRIAESTFVNEEVILNEVISFNKNMITNSPDYAQSYFILGFLYYKKRNNIPLAYQYFENYKRRAKDPKFNYLTKRVDSYLNELNQWMKLK